MPCDPGPAEAEGNGCNRHAHRPVHPAGRAGLHPLRQWPGVRCPGGTGLDQAVGARTAYIEPGSPWENGYCESFNARFRDELLNGEIFYTLQEAQILIEEWRRHYNTKRPHSALGYRPPAPETIVQMDRTPGLDPSNWSKLNARFRAQSFWRGVPRCRRSERSTRGPSPWAAARSFSPPHRRLAGGTALPRQRNGMGGHPRHRVRLVSR